MAVNLSSAIFLHVDNKVHFEKGNKNLKEIDNFT